MSLRTDCCRCGADLDTSHTSYCKECLRTYRMEWHNKNKDRSNEYQRKYRAEHPEMNSKAVRKSRLKMSYGLTEVDLQTMTIVQDSRCGICKREITLGGRKFDCAVVDHDHNTGAIRGLLCGHCNRAIGMFGDNIEVLKSAISYLERKL